MRYEEKPQITEQEIREAMDFSTAQVKRNLPEFTTKFQKAYSENGFYAPTDNVDWTTGFWTGEIWLSYEDTGKDIYKKAGEIQIDSFLNRIENKIEVDHHDMGFLYSPSCVAGYKLKKCCHCHRLLIFHTHQHIFFRKPVREIEFHIVLFIPEAPMPNLFYLWNHLFCCKPYFHLKSPVQYNFSAKYQDNRIILPFAVLHPRHHLLGLHNYTPDNYALQTAG